MLPQVAKYLSIFVFLKQDLISDPAWRVWRRSLLSCAQKNRRIKYGA